MKENEKIGKVLASRDIASTLLALGGDDYIEEVDGSVYKVTCPKCKEQAMEANVEIQMCRCKHCGLSGNIIDVVRVAYNTTADYAADFLIKDFLDDTAVVSPQTNELLEINRDAANFFFKRLRQKDRAAQNAMSYFRDVRKMSKETMREFGLGYAGSDGKELYMYLKDRYPEELIKQSGLITFSEKGTYDKFRNRVIFPIMNIAGKVIGFGGRVMGDELPKYLNSPETSVFIKGQNLYGMNNAAKAGKRVILVCEGFMDTIALQSAGYKHSVASLGTALTEHHVFTIKRYAEVAYFLYDTDEPGIKAALRGIELANAAGLKVKTVDLSPYKDPDEFLKNNGKEAFEQRLRDAISSEEFVKKYKKDKEKDEKKENEKK